LFYRNKKVQEESSRELTATAGLIFFKRPVVCFFRSFIKITGRQFSHPAMVRQTFAAQAFAGTGIRAIASIRIFIFLALHPLPPALS
jgi:hypothetical protein